MNRCQARLKKRDPSVFYSKSLENDIFSRLFCYKFTSFVFYSTEKSGIISL